MTTDVTYDNTGRMSEVSVRTEVNLGDRLLIRKLVAITGMFMFMYVVTLKVGQIKIIMI